MLVTLNQYSILEVQLWIIQIFAKGPIYFIDRKVEDQRQSTLAATSAAEGMLLMNMVDRQMVSG